MPLDKRQKIQPAKNVSEGLEKGADKKTLRETVKQAMLAILADKSAPSAAKASAGRTLLEYFDGHDSHGISGKRSAEMTLDELNAEIAAIESKK